MLTDPVPHQEAAERIADKPAVTRAAFDRLLPELRGRAFLVSGVEDANTLQEARDIVAGLPLGGDWDEAKSALYDQLSPWLVDPTADDEERDAQERATERRAELLLRHHGWQAYAVTNHELMSEHQDAFPYAMYISSEDERTRETHAALNRRIVPADSPFWDAHTPPWEFGCRCDKVPMTAEEAGEIQQAEASRPLDERRVMDGIALAELEQGTLVMPGGTGTLDVRAPREKQGDDGYEFRPDDLRLTPDQILDRYDPDIRSEFQAWATAAQILGTSLSVWAWMTGLQVLPRRAPRA